MFNYNKITGFVLAALFSVSMAQLVAPYNVLASGEYVPDAYGNEVAAITWTWLDDNVSSGNCADGNPALEDCAGNQFCNDDPQFSGYDCVVNNGSCLDVTGDGIITDWLGDGYCDDGAYGLVFQCDDYGWDCGDCGDPIVDPNDFCSEAPPVNCEDQGLITCPDGSCAATEADCPVALTDCQGNVFEESLLSWIGDGYCDGVDMAYGLDFACPEYDCDGCDCVGDAVGQSEACLAECGGVAANPPVAEKTYFSLFTDNEPQRIVPTYDVRTGEYDPGNMIPDSRLISYTVSVEVLTGAYAGFVGDFTANTETISITGFAEGDEACGFVTTLDGTESSPPSCTACGVAAVPNDEEPCDPGQGGGGECDDYDVAGDVNNDDSVNVLDIVSVVNHILGTLLEGCELGAGDLNSDGEINVLDIVSIVNIILGTDARSADATSATMRVEGNTLNISGNGFIGAVQMTLSHGSDFSISLTDDAMVADYATNGNSTTLVVVVPGSEEIFTATGDYDIDEVIVANSSSMINVIEPGSFTL
ncbi:MAG TPA: hypothetical protein DGM69_07070, partial [Chloroflexi bacterium]|nr:hypothetical protein [Chloroflexota bacterium]